MDRIRPAIEAFLVAARARVPRYPPLFVVGAPRSGTTLVGLHLANTFELAYFPNVAKRFSRAPYLRTREALRRGAYRPTYENAFGEAPSDLAPSDGWAIWNRWFAEYSGERAPEAESARHLATLIALFERLFDGPFLCKNNANAARIAALDGLFPSARFVHVARALPETVASLLDARRRHGVKLGEWWSAAPPQFAGRRFESELEQSVATVVGLDDHVVRELARLPRARWMGVEYEAFCERPRMLTDWVSEGYASAGTPLRPRVGDRPERFEASRLEPARRAQLEREIEPLRARFAHASAPAVASPR